MLTDSRTRSQAPAGGRPSGGWDGAARPDGGGWSRGPVRAHQNDGPATWALFILTLASAAGLFRVFTGSGWVAPVLLTVAVTHLALWAMRRAGISQVLAAPAAVAVVVLMVIWTVFGRATAAGFPGPHAWASLSDAVRNLGSDFASTVSPVAPTHGFLVLAAGGGGLVAIVGDWATFRWGSPLLAVLAALAVFIAVSTEGVGGGRAWVVGVEVAALCAFLVAEHAGAATGQVWFAGVRTGALRSLAIGGATAGALALVASVAVTPALSSRDGVGALGWRAGTGPGSGGERIVPNPIVSLRTRLIQLSNTPVFVVSSTVPSYWRLTSLDTFNGVTWTATGSYRDFSTKLPGATVGGPGTRTVRATFSIQQLNSVWLPDQFTPVAVRGVHDVSYDPGSGSLIASGSTSNGLNYSVDSTEFLDTLTPAALEAAPLLTDTAAFQSDLELPAVVDGPITQLAAEITAGKNSEYDKALAIQNYLRSSRYSYDLNPPSDGSDSQALYNFLFVTRQGYCQQFAGAYAVLARAAGLPTRLAVGFATGTPVAGGSYQVYDRDAHTWPEVYFGPQYGWLPFEPTPGFSVPGTSGYAGTSDSGVGGPSTVPTTTPSSSSGSAPAVHKGVTPTTRHTAATTVPPVHPRAASSGFPAWAGALLAIPTLLAVWAAGKMGVREALRLRRRRRAQQAGPEAMVLQLWADVCAELSWAGIDRAPSETYDEFAHRAGALVDGYGRTPAWLYPDGAVASGARRSPDGVGDRLAALAGLARRAAFSPSVPPDLVAEATATADAVHHLLAGRVGIGERLRRSLWLPPGQWARVTKVIRPS